ncbi:fasciclin domain-containing protein [Methanosarcina sp. MSH10X1]|uniref:fasciclin domain-containing protein n=1 Tax=Methanosarcina sp. MSH10X1 TaxID=2507075 RepID=UPI001F0BCCA0|nr:fasciclin domain-containing protein [Methanosarcina sp. MSH10X1]
MEEEVTPIEGATPAEDATPASVEEVAEPDGEGAVEELISDEEEVSFAGGGEVTIPGEGETGQDNETSAENQEQGNDQTIVQVAEGSGYATFASLVRDTGLEETLKQGGPYTVFAPTDIAFESLPEGMLDELSNDREKLNRVLTYHVTSGEYRASGLKNVNSLTSLETGELAVNATTDEKVTIESATVIEPDIIAGNGVIHGIDRVLIPSEI